MSTDNAAVVRMEERFAPHCSFCAKAPPLVARLLAGSTATICDECIEICAHILTEEFYRSRRMTAADLGIDEDGRLK